MTKIMDWSDSFEGNKEFNKWNSILTLKAIKTIFTRYSILSLKSQTFQVSSIHSFCLTVQIIQIDSVAASPRRFQKRRDASILQTTETERRCAQRSEWREKFWKKSDSQKGWACSRVFKNCLALKMTSLASMRFGKPRMKSSEIMPQKSINPVPYCFVLCLYYLALCWFVHIFI